MLLDGLEFLPLIVIKFLTLESCSHINEIFLRLLSVVQPLVNALLASPKFSKVTTIGRREAKFEISETGMRTHV